MKKVKFGGFPIIFTFVMFAVSSIWSDAFGNCEDVLKKGSYRCSFKAFNKNRVDEAFLGGRFVPNTDMYNPVAPPFKFENECLLINIVTGEPYYSGEADFQQTLACGCNPYSALFPILNASDVFTCVGNLGDETVSFLVSFSGKPILGGLKIVNSNLTVHVIPEYNPDIYSNVIGHCVPDPTPCDEIQSPQ